MAKDIPNFILDWKIDIYSLIPLLEKDEGDFTKCDFYLENFCGTAWTLHIFFVVTEGDRYLGARLRRQNKDDGPSEVEVNTKVGLLVAPKSFQISPVRIHKFEKSIFLKGEESEDILLAPWKDIFLKDRVLKIKDTLIVRLSLRPKGFVLPHYVKQWYCLRSSFSCRRHFKWIIKEFKSSFSSSFFKRPLKIIYVLERTSMDGAELKFEIFQENSSSSNKTLQVRVTCDKEDDVCFAIKGISIVDKNGDKLPCLEKEQTQCFRFKGQVWMLPPLITKRKLKEDSQRFLPNDQLTLCFELVECTQSSDAVLEYIKMGEEIPDTPTNLSLSWENLALENASNDENSLGSDLSNLWDNGIATDFELWVDPEIIRVHKAVLCARSHVFAAMLTTLPEKNGVSMDHIKILDMDVDTTLNLLRFIYSDRLPPLDYRHAMALYNAAVTYKVLPLQKRCSQFLSKSMCGEHICEILNVSHKHSDDRLKNSALEFLSHNHEKIMNSKEWFDFENENSHLAEHIKSLVNLQDSTEHEW